MTKQERRDGIINILQSIVGSDGRYLFKNFNQLTGENVCVCRWDDIANFILSEQAKAVAEVVESLVIYKNSVNGDNWAYGVWTEPDKAIDQALTKAREYTEGV